MVFIILGFTVTLLSQLLTFFLVRLLGRRSIIIFMMVVLMGAACSIMFLESFLETQKLITHPEELRHFGSICPAPGNQGLQALLTYLLNQLRA
jgi:NADH:ubiquinone oxidoreductase subunit 3 (subunit A)